MHTEIVVARYAESLDWIAKYPDPSLRPYIRIYNKGPDDIAIPGCNIERLPNIGREAHTHLHYIVENWDRLPRHVWFMQGDPWPHLEFDPTEEKWNALVFLWTRDLAQYGYSLCNIHKNSGVSGDYREPDADPADLAYGDWVEKNLGFKFKGEIFWWPGACFGVSRSAIKSRPLEFYQNLLAQLNSPKPDVAYYLERSWFYIFNPNLHSGPCA